MSSASPRSAELFRVVIAGGGVAALEGALALRELAPDRTELTIASAAPEFVYRPFAVLRPFRAQATYRIDLAQVAADLSAELVDANAAAVDPEGHELVLADRRRLPYDALLIAIGARAEAVVGAGTLTPWDWGEGHAYRSILGALGKGKARSVAFIVPSGLTWALPLYELALLTGAYVRDELHMDVSLTVVTSEREPLEVFGGEASAAVAALLERRRIGVVTESEVTAIEAGTLKTSSGAMIGADVTAAVPVIRSRELDGVPTDGAGFITVDPLSRVTRTPDVFAAGDCTSGRVKQGGLAAQQADTAAAGIAALAGAPLPAEPVRYELHAVLLTGEAPLHLERDRATPIVDADAGVHPHPAEKIVARYLSSYLARATPPLRLDTPG